MAITTPPSGHTGSDSLRNHAAFIWSVADLLRGDYKQSEYGKVILPLTVIRRLDCVLEPTKGAVLAATSGHHRRWPTGRQAPSSRPDCPSGGRGLCQGRAVRPRRRRPAGAALRGSGPGAMRLAQRQMTSPLLLVSQALDVEGNRVAVPDTQGFLRLTIVHQQERVLHGARRRSEAHAVANAVMTCELLADNVGDCPRP